MLVVAPPAAGVAGLAPKLKLPNLKNQWTSLEGTGVRKADGVVIDGTSTHDIGEALLAPLSDVQASVCKRLVDR